MARRKKKNEPVAVESEATGDETLNTTEAAPKESEVDTLRRERDEALASWQRARADYQNLKRRTLADIDAATRRAQAGMLDHMLLVIDYLDMALATECQTDEGKALHTGVEMTRSQLTGVLERENVRSISTDGPFDPDVHQAVATIDTDEHEPGVILEVVRPGWMLGEQVLRYAQVKVSAASEPKEEEVAASDDSPAADEVP